MERRTKLRLQKIKNLPIMASFLLSSFFLLQEKIMKVWWRLDREIQPPPVEVGV